MDIEGNKLGYKEAYRVCQCGSKIFYNLYRPIGVQELCNKCQEIAKMKQTVLHDFGGQQKKIHDFKGE